MNPRYRGRFAPSPTGPLHMGSLLAALGSWLMARRAGGEWLVRIEDIDTPRCVVGMDQQQLHTLAAFGMTSDHPVVWQSQRGSLYQRAVDRLLASDAVFPCRCSRTNLQSSAGGIHRRCVAAPSGDQPALRLRVPDHCEIRIDDAIHGLVVQRVDEDVGDFVLRRADGLWAYQLAVVVDDAEQGVTHVVRGADLLDSCPRQRLLQQRLGLPAVQYAHLPLVLDSNGQKLSKSSLAMPVEASRPIPALQQAWRLLGQTDLVQANQPVEWLQRALASFQPERIPRHVAPPAMVESSPHGTSAFPV